METTIKATGIQNTLYETYIEDISVVINTCNSFSDVISNALMMSHGLKGWFKEYIVSDTFKNLQPE